MIQVRERQFVALPPPPLTEPETTLSWPCYRCGRRNQVREKLRGYICVDCKLGDPEGVTMLRALLPPSEGGTMGVRNAFALDQLVTEVKAVRGEDTEVTYGEPDGLGVVREVRFDAATSKWLEPLLTGGELDPRIAEAHVNRRVLTVVFQPGSPQADDRTEFGLEGAAKILAPEKDEKPS